MPRVYTSEPLQKNQSSKLVAQELSLPVKGRLKSKIMIGRREWMALPELGIDMVTAKVDTGAYTSSLHAENIEAFERDGEQWVKFVTFSHHGDSVPCEARVHTKKRIKSSTGVGRKRVIIQTKVLVAGGFEWQVLFSLADRSVMQCPLLLGRKALSGYFVVDTQASHLFGNIQNLKGKLHHKRS